MGINAQLFRSSGVFVFVLNWFYHFLGLISCWGVVGVNKGSCVKAV